MTNPDEMKAKEDVTEQVDKVESENAAQDTVVEAEADVDLQVALEEAQKKADENWEKYVRLQAEMENQRRRFEKQVDDAHKYASKKFIEAILPVVDSLEMGMQADGDLDSIREGMNMTLKQFESVMEKFKLEALNPIGETFDPAVHQAMSMQPCDDQEDNTVKMVMQKGYLLNGRLIRPAMVMVCKN